MTQYFSLTLLLEHCRTSVYVVLPDEAGMDKLLVYVPNPNFSIHDEHDFRFESHHIPYIPY